MALTTTDVILIKLEATYGVDPTPTPADNAIQVSNVQMGFEGLRMNDRQIVKPSIETLQQIYGGSLMNLSFDVEIKGSGTPDVPPEFGVALQAGGLTETINAGTSVVYTPADFDSIPSATLYYYEGGVKLFKLLGARANPALTYETGGLKVFSFSFRGHWELPIDTTVTGTEFDMTKPAPVLGMPFSIGGVPLVANSFSMDMGSELSNAPDMTSPDGYGEVRISSRDVAGSMDPESLTVATYDPWTDLQTGKTEAMIVGPVGSDPGNIVQIDLPAVYNRDISPGEREQIRIYDQTIGATTTQVGANDELTLTFT